MITKVMTSGKTNKMSSNFNHKKKYPTRKENEERLSKTVRASSILI